MSATTRSLVWAVRLPVISTLSTEETASPSALDSDVVRDVVEIVAHVSCVTMTAFEQCLLLINSNEQGG